MLNHIVLMGRLTADPVGKDSKNGKRVALFTLAVDRGMDEADFINCVAWEKQADVAEEYLRKGQMVAVEGRLQIRQYEKDGDKRTAAEVIVGRIHFTGKKE